MSDLIFEEIDKKSIPEPEYSGSPPPPLSEAIRHLHLNKALKFKCKNWASAKSLQSAAHQAAAYIRRTHRIAISLRTQVSEKKLTPSQQKRYDACNSPGTFKRTVYLYVWKEKPE